MNEDQASVTQLLQDWGGGDREALEQLTPKVSEELHRLACWLHAQGARAGMDKRGSVAEHLNLDDAPELAFGSKNRGLVAVDDALLTLEKLDPRKAKVVELKFFCGLTVEATAEVMQGSPQTVMRAWLMGELAS